MTIKLSRYYFAIIAVLLGFYCFLYIGVIFDYDARVATAIPILKARPSFRLKYSSIVEREQYERQHSSSVSLTTFIERKLTPAEQIEEDEYRSVASDYHLTPWQPVLVQTGILLIVVGLITLLRQPRKVSISRYATVFIIGLALQFACLLIPWNYLGTLLNSPLLFYSCLAAANFLLMLLLTKRTRLLT